MLVARLTTTLWLAAVEAAAAAGLLSVVRLTTSSLGAGAGGLDKYIISYG